MIRRIHLPLWAEYCIKYLVYRELPDGGIIIDNCQAKSQCWGCNPHGTVLEVNPAKLRNIREVCSMNYPEEELDGVWLTEKIIKGLLEPYRKSNKQFYYTRNIKGDLDTITIFKMIK